MILLMNKAKVYRNIICLEARSRDGGKWWYQGGNLAYTPIHAKEIIQVSFGRIKDTGREVLTTAIDLGGEPQLVAINFVRSDMAALVAYGHLPKDYPVKPVKYTPYPENQTLYKESDSRSKPHFYA